MTPLVSIIIPFYNDRYITYALDSVLAQSYPFIEIIVIDDGSTRWRGLLRPYQDRIIIIRTPNRGTASALNVGLAAAKGDYIAWLSSDDCFAPHKVAIQLYVMMQARAPISCTAYDYMDENGLITDYEVCPASQPQLFYRSMIRGNPINGCTVMLHRTILNRIGNFDESLEYTQDLDYWCRILLHGVPMLVIEQSLTQYRVHSAMGTKQHEKALAKEAALVFNKYEQSLLQLIEQNFTG